MPLFSGNPPCLSIQLSLKPNNQTHSSNSKFSLCFEITVDILTDEILHQDPNQQILLISATAEKKKPPGADLCHVGKLQKLLCPIFYRNSFLHPFLFSPPEHIMSWPILPCTCHLLLETHPALSKNLFCCFCFSSGQATGLRKPMVLAK